MTELFRGYVATKNKKCIQKFSEGEPLFTLEEAEKLKEYAGVLAPETVLIDVDDMEQAERFMDIVEKYNAQCYAIYTTRGTHFYFKNNGKFKKCQTHAKLACGITADIKIGLKNSYAILKYKNEKRKIAWEPEGETAQAPVWCTPVKTDFDFWNMAEGDGRNDKLFSYILLLQKAGISKDDIKFIYSLINEFILKDKLSDSELNTILRDEAFVEPDLSDMFFTERGSFKFDVFSHYLIENHKIIKINNQLHIYKGGIYNPGLNAIQAEMIKHVPNLTKQKRNEVLAYLDLLIPENTPASDAEFIAFKNGIYNIDTGDFMEFDPDIVVTNKINHNYNPDAYSDIADNTLNKLSCNDSSIRSLLEEVVGYTFYRRNELRKAFILTGDKHNGKSTYIDMIARLLGEENTTALDLRELGDRFKTAELFGKLANVGDDIGDEFISNPAVFKKIVSGDRLNVERKGQDPFNFAPYAKMIFSANSIPRIKDKSGAVLDRLIIVPFEASFSRTDPDYAPYIKYKLREESVMEYLIQIGLAGLRRVLDNQGFTQNDKVQGQLKEYEQTNNPILLFLEEIDECDIINCQTRAVYQRYCEYCMSCNYQEMSMNEFSKFIKKKYSFEIKVRKENGRSIRVFCK